MSEKALGELLKNENLKLATAESCTGGLLGSKITDVPGASSYYMGGIIAYSNEIKTDILGVKRETIERYGAVSKECALEMVSGVSKLFGSQVSIATTGIAGPSGGTKDKPVGLVFIAIKVKNKINVEKFIFNGNRIEIKEKVAEQAIRDTIKMLHEMI
jgi:PncC family amidohydrolase